ncbi:MAG: Arm DNA-binding domain-containing protein, partial [Pseudomonadota bacterium]
MALTDMKIRALRPETKTKKYSDGGGLHLKVDPTGSPLWRCSYRFNGKQKTLAFGRYPEVSLAQARKKRDDAKRLLAKGIDPGLEIKKLKLRRKAETTHTFEALARELLNKRAKEGLSDVTLRKKEWLLEMATKSFGSYPIIDVKTADILSVIREIEDRGNYETAKRLRTSIGEVFRYAIAIGACEYDPT